jgi:hypothetical protein
VVTSTSAPRCQPSLVAADDASHKDMLVMRARRSAAHVDPLASKPGAAAGVALSLVSGDLPRAVRPRKQDNDRHLGP